MKKAVAFLVGASALFGAQVANATTYSPTGTHVFAGQVTVQKDGSAYTCTLTVTVNAATSSATATAALSGGFPCSLITISGTGTVTANATATQVTISGLTIDPPLSPGVCNGSITAGWNGGVTPRQIILSVPLSNSAATSGAACKMAGTLSQTSGGPLTITP